MRSEASAILLELLSNITFIRILNNVQQKTYKRPGPLQSSNQPYDCMSWNEKDWSYLGKVSGLGMDNDPGNFVYLYALVVLVSTLDKIPQQWDRLKEFDVKNLPSGVVTTKWHERAGDKLESLGGILDWQDRNARKFASFIGITDEAASHLLALLSSYLQKMNMFNVPYGSYANNPQIVFVQTLKAVLN